MTFSTGFYYFHPDTNINFQLNRFLSFSNGARLEDMQKVAAKIHDFNDWKREFLALADEALAEGRELNAAIYYRAAEFFMHPEDKDKVKTYEKFTELISSAFGVDQGQRYNIPYQDGCLPVLHFPSPDSKGTILAHGGFDSFIEELYPLFSAINEAGYEVYAFEGPGQGSALNRYRLAMTPEWEKPVSCLLDYFHLDDVTILGVSLGGYLALRAAAFDARIKRVIAFDVLYDSLRYYSARKPAFSAG